jgi:RNA polymerase sigma factor for flagellar operon FliA
MITTVVQAAQKFPLGEQVAITKLRALTLEVGKVPRQYLKKSMERKDHRVGDGSLLAGAAEVVPFSQRANNPDPNGVCGKEARSEGLSLEREKLMMDNLQTVRFIAQRMYERLPQHVELEELISAGMLGLLDACFKFDPGKNVQFNSYAQFRVRGAILDSLRSLDWSPRELRRKGREVEEAIRSMTARMGRAATEPEIAQSMKISLVEYQKLLGELKGLEIGSLNMEHSEDSGEEELSFIPNKPELDPLFLCLKGEMRQHLIDAMETLPERERLVITLYYYEELTMREIGVTLGVVESRISQIHSAAVLRLRMAMKDLSNTPVEKIAKPIKTTPIVPRAMTIGITGVAAAGMYNRRYRAA